MTRDEIRRARLARAICAGVAFCGGAIFALTSPPTNLYVLTWIGLAIFAAALALRPPRGASRVGRFFSGAGTGVAFGFGANLVALRFVPAVILRFTSLPLPTAWLALILLAAAQGIPWAIAGMVHDAMIRRGRVVIYHATQPSLTVHHGGAKWLAFGLGVYAASFFPAVFPWTPAGGVTPWPAMVELASAIGERGVTLLMALTAGLFASAVLVWRENPVVARRMGALALAIPLLQLAYGALAIHAVDAERALAPRARIALVDPAFEARMRWDPAFSATLMQNLTEQTKRAEAKNVDLVVWPESAYPWPMPHDARTQPRGRYAILGPGVHGPVLTGAYLRDAQREGYNAALIAYPNGSLSEPYDKRRLLWFGETVPLADAFPWLRKVFSRGTGLTPGTHNVIQEVHTRGGLDVRAGIVNCYEDTVGEAGRDALDGGANLLVNVTNDAWFVNSAESELHLRLAVLRAVELRRDLVRAVNMGPTSFVDAAGRVRDKYDVPIPGSIVVEPALLDGKTLYARFGDLPLAILCALAAASELRRAKKRAETLAPQKAEGAGA